MAEIIETEVEEVSFEDRTEIESVKNGGITWLSPLKTVVNSFKFLIFSAILALAGSSFVLLVYKAISLLWR